MSLDLFRVAKGLQLESEDFLNSVNVLFGTGAPGGDSSDQDAAERGSLYLRTDTEANGLQLYYKQAAASGVGSPTGSAADWRLVASQSYVDAVAAGISWREPPRVLDNTLYANVAAVEAAYSGSPFATVDGITLSNGDRILLTNLTSGNENVYVVNFTGSPILGVTLTEDTNLATDGDALLIQDGSFAETQWVYDGTQWIQFSTATASAELGFIRDFIGKNAPGAENPNYSSTDVVTPGTDLESAIGELDDSIGTRSYTENNFVANGEDLTSSIDALDQQVQNNVDGITTNIGDIVDLEAQTATVAATGVTSQTVIDEIPLSQAEWVKWLVAIEEVADSGNRRFGELDVITDGVDVDYNDFGRLKLGGAINGLGYSVDLGVGGSPGVPTLRLLVESTSAVDVTVKRLGFGTFN